MSFSSETKKELCAVDVSLRCCMRAQTGALLLFSRLLSGSPYRTKHGYIARAISECAAACCGVTVDIIYPEADKGKVIYTVSVPFDEDRKLLEDDFGGADFIKASSVSKSCCFGAFMRGTFLACGTLTDPQKDYHLEFSVQDDDTCERLMLLLSLKGFTAGRTTRKNEVLVYFKDADSIERLLLEMGAKEAYFNFTSVRAVRVCRNNVQRRCNCDNGNLKKTIEAAGEQVAAIKRLQERGELDSLPEELRELALLRMENPEMNLAELGRNLSTPLSKSGVNHRLKKLLEMGR